MKLRYWYKIDHNKQPIPGSNIRRKSRPGDSHQWKEILNPCCYLVTIDCTCGPRYFIQLDGLNKPVDHSLIKRVDQPRRNFPEGTDGMKFYELPWKSQCCASLDWEFTTTNSGNITITINGTQVVNNYTNSSGSIIPNIGDIVSITIGSDASNSLVVSGGNTFNDTQSGSVNFTFPWNVQNTIVVGIAQE